MRTRYTGGAFLALTAGLAIAPAQRTLQFDVVYSCSSGQTRLKVLGCAGNSGADSCDIQYLDRTAAQGLGARISAPRNQVVELLQTCAIERPPARVENPPPAVENPPSARTAPPQRQAPPPPPTPPPAPVQQRPAASPASYRMGEYVQISIAGGWVDGQVVAFGVSDGEYRVAFPDGRAVWTTGRNLRPMPAAKPSAAPVAKLAGAPCGSKLEGRWDNSQGNMSLEIRGAKAHLTSFAVAPETYDCSISGDKIMLREPGDPETVIWRLNDDGTIAAPFFGELKRKGK